VNLSDPTGLAPGFMDTYTPDWGKFFGWLGMQNLDILALWLHQAIHSDTGGMGGAGGLAGFADEYLMFGSASGFGTTAGLHDAGLASDLQLALSGGMCMGQLGLTATGVAGGVGAVAARAGGKAAGLSVEAGLREHLEAALTRFGEKGFTPAQARAIGRNPRLAPMFRGERIDYFFTESLRHDGRLLGRVQITPRGSFGPDVISGGRWYDVTTARQWQAHVTKYAPFGPGRGLFY